MIANNNAVKRPINGDGFRFTMKDKDTNEPIFAGDLQTLRCTGRKKDGLRCSRNVTIGLPYCFQHRVKEQELSAKKSSIPNSGQGLYVNSKEHGANAIVFRPKQKIVNYVGQILTNDEIDERYDDYTAPYALQLGANRNVDASLLRGLASQANAKRTLSQCNAKLSRNNQGQGFLVATKNIRNGQEIFAYYGNEYTFDTIHTTKYVRPRRP